MDVTQQIVPMRNSQIRQPDHDDMLEPGYGFFPTDSELIVYYLKEKIETGKHPKCRMYEVNIYDYHPKDLTDMEEHRPSKGNWYFLTPRERKYPNGKRPNRQTQNFGHWKITKKYSVVYDDVRTREEVGTKRSFAYFDAKGNKTEWLMYEYATNDPDLPVGTEDNKLSDWVLCKIYKTKQKDRIDNNDHSRQVENARNDQEQNNLHDEPSPTRRNLSVNQESNQYHQNQYSMSNLTNGFQFSSGSSSSYPMTSVQMSLSNVQQNVQNSNVQSYPSQNLVMIQDDDVVDADGKAPDEFDELMAQFEDEEDGSIQSYPSQNMVMIQDDDVVDADGKAPDEFDELMAQFEDEEDGLIQSYPSQNLVMIQDDDVVVADGKAPDEFDELMAQFEDEDNGSIQSYPSENSVVIQDEVVAADHKAPDAFDELMALFDDEEDFPIQQFDSSELYFSLDDLLD